MKAELETLVDQMITRGILFEEAVEEFEKRFILSVVSRNHNNLSKAASELGIHRNTLSKRLGEYKNMSDTKRQKRRHVAHRHKRLNWE
jgi:Fis family transcriptional regulator, factor for inversion stimulation protein